MSSRNRLQNRWTSYAIIAVIAIVVLVVSHFSLDGNLVQTIRAMHGN